MEDGDELDIQPKLREREREKTVLSGNGDLSVMRKKKKWKPAAHKVVRTCRQRFTCQAQSRPDIKTLEILS